MKRVAPWIRPIAVSALFLLTLPAALSGQHVIDVPQNRAAFTRAQAEAVFREVIPVVERVTQRRFKQVPPLKLVTRTEFLTILAAVSRKEAENTPKGARRAGLGSQAMQEMSLEINAFYLAQEKTLYFISNNMPPQFLHTKSAIKDRVAYLKNMMAHELVHAMQDQEVGWERFHAGLWYDEERMARKSLVEGHATFVADLVSMSLGDSFRTKSLANLFDPTLGPPNQAAPTPSHQALGKVVNLFYIAGSQFVAHFHGQGGMNRVWKLFDVPPSDMGMILHPERYSPVRRIVQDYSQVFEGVPTPLGPSPVWTVTLQVGPWSLETLAIPLRGATAEEKQTVVDRVVTCLHRVTSGPDGRHVGLLTMYELDNSESVPIMLELVNDVRRRASEPTLPGPNGVSSRTTPGLSAATIKAATQPPEPAAEPPQDVAVSSWGPSSWLASARKGRYLVTFAGSFEGMTREAMTALLKDILSRLDLDPGSSARQ